MQKIILMQLDNKLYNEIKEYCELNGLKTRDFIHRILKDAFLREKYGDTPFSRKNTDMSEHNENMTGNLVISKNSEKEKRAEVLESVDVFGGMEESEAPVQENENEDITQIVEVKREFKKKRTLK